MAADNNLGNLNATVSFTPETEEFERKTAEMAAKIKRQFDELGGKTISQLAQDFNGLTNTVTSGIDAINAGIAKVKNVAELGFLGVGLGNFVHQVFQTRSYFQDAASSMKTFLGDAEKGAKFTKELQDYAFYNMYEFSDLIGVSKQLIAYGTTDTKEIITVVDQLSNIATGTGADINSMIDIYNKVKASGTANGIVLDQLASRGLLVKQTLQEMGETVNGNKVTFEQFQKVLKHVTDEGGMFHDLMKEQLNNLSASSAQLSDNLTAMYNEIGEKAEPYMKEAIDLAGLIVENYQEVAAVLFDIAKAYGIYKVAASAIEWNKNNQEEEHIKRLAEEKVALEEAAEATKAFKNEDLQAEVAKNKLTQAEADQIAKLREQVQEENKLRISKGNLTQEQAKELAIIKEGLLRREQELKKIKDQAAEEVKAKEKEIAAIEKKIAKQKEEVETAKSFGNEGKFIAEAEAKKLNALETEKQTLETQKYTAQKRAEEAEVQKNTIATARETAAKTANAQTSSVWSRGLTAAGSALKGIGSSIVEMINPTGLAIAAIGFLCTKVYELYTAESELEKSQARSTEIRNEYLSSVGKEQAELASLYGKLHALQEGTDEYNSTKNEIISKYDEYLKYLGKEKEALEDIESVYYDIKKAIEEKYKAETLSKVETLRIESETEAFKTFQVQGEKYIKNATDKFTGDNNLKQEKYAEYMTYWGKAMEQIKDGARMIDFTQKGARDKFKDLLLTASKENGNILQMIDTWSEAEYGGIKRFKLLWEDVTTDNDFFEKLEATATTYASDKRFYSTYWNNTAPASGGKENKPSAPAQRLKKAKDDNKKYIEEYAKIVEERDKKIREIDKQFDLSQEEKDYKIANLETEYGWKIDKLRAGSVMSPKTRERLEKKYQTAADVEIDIAKEKYLEIQKKITALQKEQGNINLSEKKDASGKDITQDELDKRMNRYNAITYQIGELTAELQGYGAVVNESFELPDFVKKATAYEKFAKDYTANLVAVKEKETETQKKLDELDKQAAKAATPDAKADIQRQKENAKIDLENFRADQEMKRQILVNDFDGTATDVTGIIDNMMNKVSAYSLDKIRQEIILANAKLKELNTRKAMGKDVSKEIAETSASLVALDSAAKETEQAMQKLQGDSAIDYWEESKKAVDKLASAFKNLGSAVGGSGEEVLNTVGVVLSTTVSLVDNIVTFTTTSIQGIKTASTAAAVALKTIESASVILAIIGAVVQLTTAIAGLVGQKDPVDELKDSLHDFNLEMEETKRLAAQEDTFKPFNTIFGNDEWGNMLNNIRIGKEAFEEYNKTQEDIIANAQTIAGESGRKGVGWATAAALFNSADPTTVAATMFGWGNKSVNTAAGQYDTLEDTVANMKVKVKHKTWFRNEKSTSLKDAVPSLFNDTGELDKDALHKFVESNNEAFQKLSTDNQDYLKKMDESWQEYQEAVQEVKDTFSDFFGNLGSEIQDIWTNAFRAGEDGLADFSKAWDSAIENMIQSMAYNKTLGKIMSDMEKELDKSGFFENPEGNMGAAIEIMEKYEQKAQETKTAYDAILQQYRDKGYFKNDEAQQRNAVSGGIANVTQDTAEEMNGRLTQIQSHTFSINENMKLMVSMQTTQLTILQGINSNTARLATIQSDITAVKATLSDIQIRGLKLKE